MGDVGSLPWGASMTAAQLERLARGMDEMRDDVAILVTKTEVMNQRLSALEERMRHLETSAGMPKQETWQSWAIAIIGLVMSAVLVVAVLQLMTGGH